VSAVQSSYIIGVIAALLALLPQIIVYVFYALLVIKSRGKSGKPVYATGAAHDISFIIPVRREPVEYLERAIRRICEMNIPGYEIIVVSDDDEESKSTILEVVEKLRRAGCSVWFIWRSVPRGARSGALNTGLFASKNPYVYVVDVDTYPDKCFLDVATAILESSSEYAAVVGKWEPLNYESRLSAALAAALKYMVGVLYRARSRLDLYTYPLGTGTLFKSDLLKEVLGGWDEERVQDDMEIGARIMSLGLRVAYVDECAVHVENPSTYKAFRVQQCRWAYGALDTAVTRFRHIFRSKYPLLLRLEAYAYLLQYIPQVLVFTGSLTLALLELLEPRDYLATLYPLVVLYVGATAFNSLALYRYIGDVSESPWGRLTLMGRLAAVTNVVSLYTLLGAVRALLRLRTGFKRTPKGSYQLVYTKLRAPWELLLGLLFAVSGILALVSGAPLTALFLLLHAASYTYVLVRFPRDVFYE
jgi:cellulose synthase/poly-beta-1,6-N-acetylglucosamine synthase-like glycosyltransferase